MRPPSLAVGTPLPEIMSGELCYPTMTIPAPEENMAAKPRCGRANRSESGVCGQPAGWGTPHPGSGPCKLHGGSLAGSVAKHKRRLLEIKVQGELVASGWDPVLDPLSVFADTVGEVVAFKEICRGQVNRLLSWTENNTITGVDEVRAIITVYERALDRASKSLIDMLRLGLDAQALRQAKERPTREQAQTFSRILDRVLDSLLLTEEQRASVPAALAEAIHKEGLA